MELPPVSTPALPSQPAAAAAGADAAADPAAAAGQPDGDFQTMLLRTLSGFAHGAKGASGLPGAPADEDGEGTADTAPGHAEDILTASESALALLAALPPAAARPDPSAGSPVAGGKAERPGGEPAVAGLRAEDAAGPGAKIARAGLTEPAPALKADPEKTAERLSHAAEPLPDFNAAVASHNTHAAMAAAHAHAAPPADPAAAGPAQAPARVDTPLGAPGWSTALADQLVMFVGDKQQVAELHINPPHLGPVEIRLTVNDDQASAVFASPHAVVRETLESALPRLREVLAESGINLGQASVTADSPRDGSGEGQSRSSFAGGREGAAVQEVPGAGGLAALRRARGLVDLFA
jgi:flagellar hook-length control protein FliK